MNMLSIITGPMFSGKSEEFIRRCRRALIAQKRIAVFKPEQDTRTSSSVSSRNGHELKALVCSDPQQIWDYYMEQKPEFVGIDEAQFFDKSLVQVADRLAFEEDVHVVVAGLDMDFAGRPFGPMPELLALADEVVKLPAICMVCRRERATRTQRLIDGKPASPDSPLILVGDAGEGYEARCRRCFELG